MTGPVACARRPLEGRGNSLPEYADKGQEVMGKTLLALQCQTSGFSRKSVGKKEQTNAVWITWQVYFSAQPIPNYG